MKMFKLGLLLVASLAFALSVPLVAQPPIEDPDPGGGGGGGGGSATWTVVCNYNAQEVLISKTCTSGGSNTCNCP